MTGRSRSYTDVVALAVLGLVLVGCQTCEPPPDVPRELDKASLPDHLIEPPDVLQINAIRLVPLPPVRIEPLDSLFIRATNTLLDAPINGVYVVEVDGRVVLGPSYGSVYVAGLTVEEAQKAVEKQVRATVKNSEVLLTLAESRSLQLIRGEHLVRPNGKVDLGSYGSVYVAGMTTDQAKAAIEAQLSLYLQKPEVIVSVAAYNSKVYYIITDGGGLGEQVYRFPVTGNETVLDAMSQIYGLPAVASRHHIWLARPSHPHEPEQVLPIDWKAITRCGDTATNYQVLPGDRIYVQANALVTLDTFLARLYSPIERTLGITLLTTSVISAIQNIEIAGEGGITTTTTTPR
jgi:polysaccharide export outer membrane protein